MTSRLKVLISAYACSPYNGSEPGVGWGFVTELAKHHDLWVIVEKEEFRKDVDRYLIDRPELGNQVKFYFIQKHHSHTLRKIYPPSYYWYYRRWQYDVFQLAKQLHSKVGFDIAHQLNMVGFREPGYLWKLGIPFVWGPIGGMGLFPWRFLPVLGVYGGFYYLCYNMINWLQMSFLVRPRHAARAAAFGSANGLISATNENCEEAKIHWKCKSTVLAEVGLPRGILSLINDRSSDKPLRILWSGQHTPRKALNLALEALSILPSTVAWELHVLGVGQKTVAWKRLANGLSISSHVRFYGWISREQALSVMQSAHLMLITSLRDLTSTVLVEALSIGLPIICLDHCGFADVVNDDCGVKIPLTTPRQTIVALANSIEDLANNEEKRRGLANGALGRARDFSWEKKIQVINHIYQEKSCK